MKIKLSKSEWVLFIVFGIMIFFIPIILTRESNIISFKNTGEIGDTIGGITAPFLGFFGSILVYLALKAQIEANEQVRLQFEKQENDSKIEKRTEYFKNRSENIKNEINNFYYSFNDELNPLKNQKLNYQGSQAIHKLLLNSKNNYYGQKIRSPYELEPKLVELRSLLVFFDLTINDIKNDEIIHTDSKNELASFLKYFFIAKIFVNFDIMKEFKSVHDKECHYNCGNYHGIPSDLFDYIDSIKGNLEMI